MIWDNFHRKNIWQAGQECRQVTMRVPVKKTSKTSNGDKYLCSCLVECGWGASRTKDTYLKSKYDSLLPRRGQKRAIVAIGHKNLIASYYILKDKVAYRELGGNYLENLRKTKSADRYMEKLKEMGYEIEIKKAA
jgi:transposase